MLDIFFFRDTVKHALTHEQEIILPVITVTVHVSACRSSSVHNTCMKVISDHCYIVVNNKHAAMSSFSAMHYALLIV